MFQTVLATYEKEVYKDLFLQGPYRGKSELIRRMLEKSYSVNKFGMVAEEAISNTTAGLVTVVEAGKITSNHTVVNIKVGDKIVSTKTGKSFPVTNVTDKVITATGIATTDFTVGMPYSVVSGAIAEGSKPTFLNKWSMTLKNDRQIYLDGIEITGSRMSQIISSGGLQGGIPRELYQAISLQIGYIETAFWYGTGIADTTATKPLNTGLIPLFDDFANNNGLPITQTITGKANPTSKDIQEGIESILRFSESLGFNTYDRYSFLALPPEWIAILQADDKVFMPINSDIYIGRNPYMYQGGSYTIRLEGEPMLSGSNQALILNDELFELHHLGDRLMKLEDLGKTGDSISWQVVSELFPTFRGIAPAMRLKFTA